MKSLQDELVEQLVNTYKSLEKRKAEEYSARYVRILFEIGEKMQFPQSEDINLKEKIPWKVLG